MKYIIMADGAETRWKRHLGIHKWEININGETLIERTSRLLRERDPLAEIIITTHEKIEVEDVKIHVPQNNCFEIDRFTEELVKPGVCFLYGDVYYTEQAINIIVSEIVETISFLGNEKKIFAVKVEDDELFKRHLRKVREAYINDEIEECIGWELYHSIQGMPLESREIGSGFVRIEDETRDFNYPEDLNIFVGRKESKDRCK